MTTGSTLRLLDDADVGDRRVLVRVDLNVPMQGGRVADTSRIDRILPTIRELTGKRAKVILCSHLGRPKGRPVPTMSLAPVAAALSERLGRPVAFAADCIGPAAREAVSRIGPGEVLVLENTRFHPEEEKNDPAFARGLAELADIYVDDAFSAAHRAHASTEAVAHMLPGFAGRLMQAEVTALEGAVGHPDRPLAVVVGGAKVSGKLDLLRNLVRRADTLFLGGAMANTFLAASGIRVGKSLQEPEMHELARAILAEAGAARCEVVLPSDVVVAPTCSSDVPHETVGIGGVPEDAMILDIGEGTVFDLTARLVGLRTLLWNGPLGAFETPPFDRGTTAFARAVAAATARGSLRSVAGGGDTVAALHRAGVLDQFSYVSTAGGAFLEWLEGRALPGVVAVSVTPAPSKTLGG